MTWELPVVRSVRSRNCQFIRSHTFSCLIGEQDALDPSAPVSGSSNERGAARRFGVNPQFLPPLDLDDPRIMDDDFHRSESQIFQGLQDGLFDSVAFV